MESLRYDAFIAHASADLPAVSAFKKLLEDRGLRCVLDADVLRPGDEWDERLERLQEQCSATVVMLTGKWPDAHFLREEIVRGIQLRREGRHRVIPVLLEELTRLPPYGLARVHCITAIGPAAWDNAAGVIAETLGSEVSAPPELWCTRVPPEPRGFVGRDDVLDEIAGGAAERGGLAARHVIIGLGGVGKSALAASYAQRSRGMFDLVWWARGDTIGNLIADLRSLADAAGLADREGTPDEARAYQALDWLQQLTGRRWLLVVDHVEDHRAVEPLLPVYGIGQVVVTTRVKPPTGPVTPIEVELDTLSEADSIAFMKGRLGERGALDGVVAHLDGLPLALEQAAAFLEQHPTVSVERYEVLLHEADRDPFPDGTRPTGYDRTATDTWRVSIDAAATQATLARKMLEVLAVVAPDDIPLALVTGQDAASGPYWGQGCTDIDLDDALAALHAHSLVAINSDLGTLSVHRLVQDSTRRASGLDESPVDAAVDALTRMAGVGSPDPWAPYRATRLAQHFVRAASALQTIQAKTLGPDDPETLVTLHGLARWAHLADESGLAIAAGEAVLAARRASLGADHPDVLSIREDLADIYRKAGQTSVAIEMYEHLVIDLERLNGHDQPDTLRARDGLGNAYMTARREDAAIELLQALVLDLERVVGAADDRTLDARSHLADTYRAQGRLDEALELHRTVLRDRQANLAPGHSAVAVARMSVAMDELRSTVEQNKAKFHPEIARFLDDLFDTKPD